MALFRVPCAHMAAKGNKSASGSRKSSGKKPVPPAVPPAVHDYVPPTAKSVLSGLIDDEMDELGSGDNEAEVEQLLNMSDFALAVDSFGVARLTRFDATEKLHVVIAYDTDFVRSQARHQLDDESSEQISRRRWLDERSRDFAYDDAHEEEEEEEEQVARPAPRFDISSLDPRGRFARDIVRRSNAIDEIEDEDDDEDNEGGAREGDDSDDIYVFDRVFGVHLVKPGHSEVLLACIASCDGSFLIRTITTKVLERQKGDADGVPPALPPTEFINDGEGVPFFEMSRELQNAIREWLATLGVDDSVATFIQEYIETRKCREQSHSLSILKNLIVSK